MSYYNLVQAFNYVLFYKYGATIFVSLLYYKKTYNYHHHHYHHHDSGCLWHVIFIALYLLTILLL